MAPSRVTVRDVTPLVGAERIRWSEGLATAAPDGAAISILPAVSGGARSRPPASTPIA